MFDRHEYMRSIALCWQVLDEAKRVVGVLEEREADGCHPSVAPRRRRLADLYDLAHKLACVAHSWAQNPESVDTTQHLKALRPEARAVLRSGSGVTAEGAG